MVCVKVECIYYHSDYHGCCSCGEFLSSVGTRKYHDGCQQFKVSLTNTIIALYTQNYPCYTMYYTHWPCSMVESFESIISTYAQQLSLNETQTFTSLSLTVVALLVSVAKNLILLLHNIYKIIITILQESVDRLAQRGKSFLIGILCTTHCFYIHQCIKLIIPN